MAFELPALPYAADALAPHISKETIDFHYGKHHNAYVVKLNELTAGKPEASKSLEEVIKSAGPGPLFNNAAQVWNHTFYWHSMKPKGGGKPTGAIAAAIDSSFGSYEAFRKEMTEAAITQFGSGWAWLVKDGGKLKVVKTANAETPITGAAKPILTVDVWEHAYYIDYRNLRPKYVETYFDQLVNWDFANKNAG